MLVTEKGSTVYDSTIFLYPDSPSQKMTQAPPSRIGNSETKEILERELDLQGLKLLAFDVPSSYTASDNSKLITLDLSTGMSADKIDITPIDGFIMNARSQIESINSRYGTRIVLIHIRIKDADNNLLVDYWRILKQGDNIPGRRKTLMVIDETLKVS